MITGQDNSPAVYEALWGPIIYSATSDHVNSLNFSYVFDVFVNSSYAGRLVQQPNSNGVGIIDVAPIARNYANLPHSVLHEIASAVYPMGSTSATWTNTFQAGDYTMRVTPIHGYDSQVLVQVNVGEQYQVLTSDYVTGATLSSVGTALQMFNGLTNSSSGWVGSNPLGSGELYVQYFLTTAQDYGDGLCRGIPAGIDWEKVYTQNTVNYALNCASLAPYLMPGSTAGWSDPLKYPWPASNTPDLVPGKFLSDNTSSLATQTWTNVFQACTASVNIVGTHDHATLQWLNIAPQMGTSDTHQRFITPGWVSIVFTTKTGSHFAYQLGNWSTASSFSPGVNAADTLSNRVVDSGTFATSTDANGIKYAGATFSFMQSLVTGPADLAPIFNSTTYPSFDFTQVAYYDVQLFSFAGPTFPGTTAPSTPYPADEGFAYGVTGTSGYNYPISQVVRYVIYNPDPNDYPPIRFSWLNSLGGRDYYNFTKYFEVTTETDTSNTFWRDPAYWNNASSSHTWVSAPWQGGTQVINNTVTRKITVVSDYIPAAEVTFLKSLYNSPLVHVWLPWNPLYPLTAVRTDASYSEKKQISIDSKLVQLSWTYELSIPGNVQTA
jgi:hypothetical protein